MRIVTWNVDGLRNMINRRKEPLNIVLQKLNADIICLQETKFNKADMKEIHDFTSMQGWNSFVGLCRLRQSYAGVVTFCKAEYTPLAAEEGLSRKGGDNALSDCIHWQDTSEWTSLKADELQHNDDEGRCMVTDHGAFVLVHLYGPAVTDIDAERFPRKLTFYKAVQLRCEALLAQGRKVIILGDLNIASRPEDQHRLANSTMPRDKLLQDFFHQRPDRQWFRDFLEHGQVTDLLRHFHPDRKGAYTVWGRQHEERKRNLGYRVDYILIAEGAREGATTDPDGTSTSDEALLLEQCQGCDIMTDFVGSDHAPVWLDLDIRKDIKKVIKQPKLESRARFRQSTAGGKTKDIASFFQKAKRKKTEHDDDEQATPPRKGETS